MKAWIIRWEWIGEHADPDDPLIAILSARCGVGDVRKFIERFHVVATALAREQIEYARYREPREIAYRASVSRDGRIDCGHNPFIVGGRGDDVCLEENGDLNWTEAGRRRSIPTKPKVIP